MNAIFNEQGKVSLTKLGTLVMGLALGIQQAGLDLFPKTDVDEKLIVMIAIFGGVLAGQGIRNAIGKGGK